MREFPAWLLRWAAPISLLLAALLTRLAFPGQPAEVVFDEVHFGGQMTAYFSGEYYFDIHPPLAKLLYAAVGNLTGVVDPAFTFQSIGDKLPGKGYLLLRLPALIAGVLLVLVLWWLALELRMGAVTAWIVSMLLVFDNALVVQSRFILLDPLLLLFGFSSLACALAAYRTDRWSLLIAAALLAGAALSVKWTGLAFPALMLLIALWQLLRAWHGRWMRAAAMLTTTILLPPLFYLSVMALHLELLPESGRGDAFMSDRFNRSLAGARVDPSVEPLTASERLLELNRVMWSANERVADHPYASPWYSWPLLYRPIYYWTAVNEPGGERQRIYLLGNPLIWWAGLWAILFLLINLPARLIRRLQRQPSPQSLDSNEQRELLLAVALLGNFVPFAFIERSMFLYHYLPALLFSLLVIGHYLSMWRYRTQVGIALVAAAALLFVWFAPLTYGLPMSEAAYQQRLWFNSWL